MSTASDKTLAFPGEEWAVFNGHVNDAARRALFVCRQRFSPQDKAMKTLEAAYRDGIMSIFNEEPTPVTYLFAYSCFIFANGLDDQSRSPEANVVAAQQIRTEMKQP